MIIVGRLTLDYEPLFSFDTQTLTKNILEITELELYEFENVEQSAQGPNTYHLTYSITWVVQVYYKDYDWNPGLIIVNTAYILNVMNTF